VYLEIALEREWRMFCDRIDSPDFATDQRFSSRDGRTANAALLTKLLVHYLPDGATREFLTTTVSASIGPLGIDLAAVAFAVGPLVLNLNVLSVVGVLLVALIMRTWWF